MNLGQKTEKHIGYRRGCNEERNISKLFICVSWSALWLGSNVCIRSLLVSPDKKKILLEKYHNLFEDKSFCVGDGWFDIINELAENLTKAQSKLTKELVVVQLKEKFGSLRVYTNYSPPEIDVFINNAELKSSKTCEECGSPGKIRSGSWLRSLCDSCHTSRTIIKDIIE